MATRSKYLLLSAAAVLVALPLEARAYRDLCTSAPSVCDYIDYPSANYLNSDVCLSSTGVVTIKGVGDCPSGSWPYYLGYGELIPGTSQVQGYIPLDDACSKPGICVEYEPHTPGWDDEMCCVSDTCYPNVTCGGTLWWCYDGVTEQDGTVTCFEAEQVG